MPGATTKKKATTSTKPSMKLTKKDEDIIKKRLKKLLEKEGVKSKPKSSTSKSSAGCCGGSCSCSKSSACSSAACYFEEKNKNKTTKTAAAAKPKAKAAKTKKPTTSSSTATSKTTATKKKTAATSNKEYSCANGVCNLKLKPKPKSKAASTKSSCEDGSCFFLKKNTNAPNKINPKKVTPMKKTDAVKPKVAPAKNPKVQPISKKTTANKSAKTAPKNKAKAITVKKTPIRGSCSPCGECFNTSSSEDYSEEEDDYSDEEQSSYTDESDFDDDFDCGGGGCGSSKKGSSNKCNDSFESGSWETDSGSESYDCSSGQCGWNIRKRDNFTDDDDNDKIDENTNQKVKNNETALVPVNRSSNAEESETDDDFISEEEDSYYEESFEEESEEETDDDMSYEDSEYSPSDSCFESDDDYQLPDSEAEDLIVRKGEAKLYPLHTDEEIDFDSDASSLQVVEIPTEKYSSDSTDPPSVKTATEQKSKNIGSDDSCPKLISIDENNYNDSDDSCPQLVPIDEESEFNAPEIFYSSESDYEMVGEEEEVPKMRAHVFVGTPNISKSEEQETSISALFRNYEETIQGDVNEYVSPLDKIANKSIDLNSSKYKIITPRSSKRKIEIDDSVLEPAKKKTVNESADHQGENNINEYNSDSLESVANLISNSSNSEDTTVGNNTKFSPSEDIVEKEIESPTTPEIASRFYNSANSRYVLLMLKNRLYLYGTVKMKLIAGKVKVFGYSPQLGETIEIFSPRGYSALYIEPSVRKSKDVLEENNLIENLDTYRKDFLSSDLREIAELFDYSTDAVVLLERNDQNKTIQMLRKYMEENLFPNMNSIGLDRPFYASEFILRCLFSLNHDVELIINPHWDSIECTSQSKIMIIGGKSVGKSTLVRYLINRNISKFKKILLIDLDIGQPEVFIPQTVSATLIESPLIGPGYLKGLLAEKSYLFGDINVVLSPISYLKNVRKLLNWCHQNVELRNIPWIVNTMGYCKGFGSELISVISQILDPTDIIQIQSRKEFNNFDYVMTPDVVKSLPRNIFSSEERIECYEPKHKLIILNTSVTRRGRSNEADFSSRDNRFAIVISRIGTILTGHNEWLSDVKPVCASIEDLNIICFSEDKLDKYDLLDVANLNLVYLCGKKDNDLECYGLGIVRGVDRFQGKIYLLPAVPVQVLQNVNTLAICNIPLPTSIVLNQGPKIRGIAPYTYNTTDCVASKHITQIYHRPKLHFSQGHRRFVRS